MGWPGKQNRKRVSLQQGRHVPGTQKDEGLGESGMEFRNIKFIKLSPLFSLHIVMEILVKQSGPKMFSQQLKGRIGIVFVSIYV